MVIDLRARWGRAMSTFARVFCESVAVAGVSEAPATNIEAFSVFGNQILGVNGLVPWLEKEVPQHNTFDTAIAGALKARLVVIACHLYTGGAGAVFCECDGHLSFEEIESHGVPDGRSILPHHHAMEKVYSDCSKGWNRSTAIDGDLVDSKSSRFVRSS